MLYAEYPTVAFVPFNLSVVIATSVIFFIIIGVLRYIFPILRQRNVAYVPVIGIVVTFVGTLVFPLIQFPLLDYYVLPGTVEQNRQEIEIVMRNLGLVTLKNVILSMQADNTLFYNISSVPFLSNQVESDEKLENAYAKISILPPRI